ncbi:hypothetical protein SMD_2379 [Stenotrophomonas maltophilia D457]|nr:hypothetical protein SMD_2379 [Stenotrophomonas maltophilia D457]
MGMCIGGVLHGGSLVGRRGEMSGEVGPGNRKRRCRRRWRRGIGEWRGGRGVCAGTTPRARQSTAAMAETQQRDHSGRAISGRRSQQRGECRPRACGRHPPGSSARRWNGRAGAIVASEAPVGSASHVTGAPVT